MPYFYQNLGEAEYVVATFMFMRLLGYPAHKISILTTYNGQKALIRDVVEQRCAPYPQFGRPHRVSRPTLVPSDQLPCYVWGNCFVLTVFVIVSRPATRSLLCPEGIFWIVAATGA